MVNWLGMAFLALLIGAHWLQLDGVTTHRPLSLLREDGSPWVGYLLFALLLAIGSEGARTARRVGASHHMVFYAVLTILLTIVALTPSFDGLHHLCSFLAMSMVYFYFAVVLYSRDEFFVCAIHLFVPIIIAFQTRMVSYGIWQKSLIAYFVAAAMLHEVILKGWQAEQSGWLRIGTFEDKKPRAVRKNHRRRQRRVRP